MDERRSYIRKSLHSTITVFDRDTNQYVGLLADFSDEGIMVTSSIKPIEVGHTYHYVLLIQSAQKSGTERANFDAVSVWCDRTSESFYGTGFRLESVSPSARQALDSCTLKQA